MPTRKELEETIQALKTENKELFDMWSKVHDKNQKLVSVLSEAQALLDRIEIPEELAAERDTAERLYKESEAQLKENQVLEEQARHVFETRKRQGEQKTTHAEKKYAVMLPFYEEYRLKGFSEADSRRHANKKAHEVDSTIKPNISLKQLSRNLKDKMLKPDIQKRIKP